MSLELAKIVSSEGVAPKISLASDAKFKLGDYPQLVNQLDLLAPTQTVILIAMKSQSARERAALGRV